MKFKRWLVLIQVILVGSIIFAIAVFRTKTFYPIKDIRFADFQVPRITASPVAPQIISKDAGSFDRGLPPGAYKGPPCRQNFGRIGIFMVYTRYASYSHATNTLRCYAVSRGYEIFVVHAFDDKLSEAKCGMFKDVFFRKHCVASVYLEKVDWLFVSDADTAVVNSDHCIEEFLDPQTDLIFYERFFTSEITSGNYLVQNSPGGRRFLFGWAAMEFEKPPPPIFVSADNGFLHIHLLRVLYPEERTYHSKCMAHLNGSLWPNWEGGYGRFIRCCKEMLLTKESSWHARAKILILPRAQGWVRDTAFTGHNLWQGDFMAHGVKQTDPFDLKMLKRLEKFVNNSTPIECYNPGWRPTISGAETLSNLELLKRLRNSADDHENIQMMVNVNTDRILRFFLILVALHGQGNCRRSKKSGNVDVLKWLIEGQSGDKNKTSHGSGSEEEDHSHEEKDDEQKWDSKTGSRKRTCSIDIFTDHHLWNHFLWHKAGLNRKKVNPAIRKYVKKLIAGVNKIYKPVNFEGIKKVRFKLRNLEIYDDAECWKLPKDSKNPFCGGALNIEQYFAQHVSRDHSDVCVAFAITHQAMHFRNGRKALGTASMATQGGYSGICGAYFEREESPGKFFSSNGGVITTSFAGRRLTDREATSLLAHELGHSLGAYHDDHQACHPGSHLMRANDYLSYFDLNHLEEKNDKLSSCSIKSISSVLREILSVKAGEVVSSGEKHNCFT